MHPSWLRALLKVNKKVRRKVRAITKEEHEVIVAMDRAAIYEGKPNAKHGIERANYYVLLYNTGAAQRMGLVSRTRKSIGRKRS